MPEFSLDIREQVARIDSLLAGVDQALANSAKLRDESNKLRDESTKLRRDATLAPWAVLATGLGAGAALFAAGAAFMKLITG